MLGGNSYLPTVLESVQHISLAGTAAMMTVIVWRNCAIITSLFLALTTVWQYYGRFLQRLNDKIPFVTTKARLLQEELSIWNLERWTVCVVASSRLFSQISWVFSRAFGNKFLLAVPPVNSKLRSPNLMPPLCSSSFGARFQSANLTWMTLSITKRTLFFRNRSIFIGIISMTLSRHFSCWVAKTSTVRGRSFGSCNRPKGFTLQPCHGCQLRCATYESFIHQNMQIQGPD